MNFATKERHMPVTTPITANNLEITKERVKEWSACSSGYRWFLEQFPQGGQFVPVYRALRAAGRADDANWLVGKISPELDPVLRVAQIAQVVGADREWVGEQVREVIKAADKDVATGYKGHAAATGNYGHAAATGDEGHAAATGYKGHAAATGNYGHAAATGYKGHAAATGNYGHAAATGNYGHAAATGDEGHAAATGDEGHAAATGNYGHAAATGDEGHAAATGNYGHAAATGYKGHAAATGEHAIAAALGMASKAMAGEKGAIVLAHFNDDGELVHIRASKVGENGVEAGKWYRLGADGQFVECEE
ncbi:hypothetical protein [Delftia tsuruhatensis]|uniref:hypothetical protein n=1 Tax=Delftia tsuruhatensis TaxID=180282 RepID=UPI00244687B8|nr:hypothetical protein [Delftia tsuruhatensis]MDH1823737.1 hypothetical protein [Delftia tsuruhatensis]